MVTIYYHLKYSFSRVNLKTGYVKKTQPETCTACAGTLILEFAALSRYTKDPIYEEKARKALDQIWVKRHQGTGLVGTGMSHTV